MFISLCPCSHFGVVSSQPLPYVRFHTKLSTVRWFELDKTKISQSQWKAGGSFLSVNSVSVSGGRVGCQVASGAQHTLNVLVLTLTFMVYAVSNDILKWNIWLILNSKQHEERLWVQCIILPLFNWVKLIVILRSFTWFFNGIISSQKL